MGGKVSGRLEGYVGIEEGRTVVAFGVVVDVKGFFGDEVGDVLVFGLFLGVPLRGRHCDGCLQSESGLSLGVCWGEGDVEEVRLRGEVEQGRSWRQESRAKGLQAAWSWIEREQRWDERRRLERGLEMTIEVGDGEDKD